MKRILVCSVLGCLTVAASCGKKGGSDPTASGGEAEKLINNTINELAGDAAQAYPQGLKILLLPEETSTALTLDESATTPATLAEAQAKDERYLEGKVDSCLSPVFLKPPAAEVGESCYDFDQDMLVVSGAPNSEGRGTLNGLDKAGKQACLVSFAKGKVKQVEDVVDRATGLVQVMLCQAKKADSSFALPDVGAKVDLASVFKGGIGARAKSITSASIERLEDVDSKPVYRSVVVMTDERGVTRETRLTHSPTGSSEDGVGTFQGSLVSFTSDGGADAKRVLTVRYLRKKSGDNVRLKYDLRMANVHKDVALESVNEAGVLDLNHGMSTSDSQKRHTLGGVVQQDPNKVFSAIRQIGFDINPASGEGSFSYWQNPGGNYHEKARGMVFAIQKRDDGKLGGCATTGAASTSVRSFMDQDKMGELAPTGTFHPFFGNDATWQNTTPVASGSDFVITQNNATITLPRITDQALAKEFAARQMANLVSYQCFVQSEDGFYAIDTDKISEEAGYEVLRTQGSAEDVAKLPPPPKPNDIEALKPLSKK